MLLRPRVIGEDVERTGRVAVAKKDRDHLLTAIMNWIPIEVIGVYKFVTGFIPLDYPAWRFWITVIVLVLTPFWIAFATKPRGRKIAWRQVFLAPFAFACWIAVIQTDVVSAIIPTWQGWMGSVILGVGTVLLPILDGIMRRCGVPQN
jgi:hypothetical protein